VGVHESGGQVTKALKQLLIAWDEARAAWDDSTTRHFEETYIVPLQTEVRNTASAIAEISALLETIRRDCT
jgi:hypothetical protein